MQNVTVNGGTLFALAALLLGDATQWIRIAQMNDLSDPMIRGLVTLQIPRRDAAAGGGIAVL